MLVSSAASGHTSHDSREQGRETLFIKVPLYRDFNPENQVMFGESSGLSQLLCPLPLHSKQSSGWSTHHSAGTRAATQLRASGRSTKSELASAVGSGMAGHAARWRSVA